MRSPHENAGPGRPASDTSWDNARRKHSTSRSGQVKRPFEIWTVKFDGTSRFYQAYDDITIAEGVRNRLIEVGLPAELRILGRRAGAL